MTVMSIDGTKNVDRRITTVVSIVLAIALLVGGVSLISESPQNIASAVAKTDETTNGGGNFGYYPSVYVSQGTFDPTEPAPTF